MWINLYNKARRNGMRKPALGFARKWSRVGRAGVSGWLCARCGGEAAVLAAVVLAPLLADRAEVRI